MALARLPRADARWRACLTLLLGLVLVTSPVGCSCSKDEEATADAVDEAEEDAVEEDAVEEEMVEDDASTEGPIEVEAAAPARPEDIAEWRAEDYMSAKQADDPRLVAAIEHFSERFGGDEAKSGAAARMLLKLLRNEYPDTYDVAGDETAADGSTEEGAEEGTEEGAEEGTEEGAEEGADGAPEGDGAPDEEVVEEAVEEAPPEEPIPVDPIVASDAAATAVVAALARNRSDAALEIQESLIKGEVETPLGEEGLLTEVLSAMARHLNPKSEALLFDMLTRPERYRPPPRKNEEVAVTPEALQSQVLESLGPIASTQLRVKMATFLADPKVPIETARLLESYLVQDHPANASAKVVLLRNPQTEPETLQAIEPQLAERSLDITRHLLGLVRPPATSAALGEAERLRRRPRRSRADGNAPGPAGAPPPVDPAEERRQLAAQLWSADVVEPLAASVRKKIDSDSLLRRLRLAGSMPVATTRATLRGRLTQKAADGPDTWVEAGLLGGDPCDPAILLAAKSLYHKGTPRRRGDDEDDKGSELEQVWAAATREMTEAWRTRLRTASEFESDRPPAGEIPFPVTTKTKIVSRFDLVWPRDAQGIVDDPPVAPLILQYVKAKEDSTPSRISSRFSRFARRGKVEETGEGVWIDIYEAGEQPGTGQSLDIILSGDLSTDSRNARPFTLECLWVEVPETAAPGEGAEPAGEEPPGEEPPEEKPAEEKPAAAGEGAAPAEAENGS